MLTGSKVLRRKHRRINILLRKVHLSKHRVQGAGVQRTKHVLTEIILKISETVNPCPQNRRRGIPQVLARRYKTITTTHRKSVDLMRLCFARCVHGMEDLQESIDDGDATEICRTAASARRLDELDDGRRLDEWDENDEDDDEGIRNSCAAGGSLPPAPATQILASEVANHKTSDDCWTSMTQGTTKIVMDITNYMTLHPGGKAYILSMCGRDSTAAFQVYHPLTYVTEAVRHGYIVLKGQLSGTYPVPTTTTVTLPAGVTTTTGPSASPQSKITAAILGQHATASDCWGRIGSWVVDMTQLRSTHPAGNSMLTCGADVTASFRSIHADSYVSRMPIQGTWDDTVIRRPATPTPTPSPTQTAAPTAAPTPAPPPQIVGGQTSILNPQVRP